MTTRSASATADRRPNIEFLTMGNSREGQVYRVRQLPLHLKECGLTASFLALIAPDLGAADNICVFSLAEEKPDSKTATVSFKITPSIFDNDREEWTLQAEAFCGRNIIADTHFRDFTVLNEPQSSPHTLELVISPREESKQMTDMSFIVVSLSQAWLAILLAHGNTENLAHTSCGSEIDSLKMYPNFVVSSMATIPNFSRAVHSKILTTLHGHSSRASRKFVGLYHLLNL